MRVKNLVQNPASNESLSPHKSQPPGFGGCVKAHPIFWEGNQPHSSFLGVVVVLMERGEQEGQGHEEGEVLVKWELEVELEVLKRVRD